ncbi:MAG: hypothetical protein ABR549_15040 [Mycobacteriales bacterium]
MAGRARLLAGLAVVVAGGLAAGAAYALDHATDDGTATAAASATPSPTPLATPSESAGPLPSAAPSPTATATPTATPTARPTPSASATRAATPKPTAPVRHYAYPAPTRTYEGLSLSAKMDPHSGSVGETFDLEGDATDGDGTIFVAGIDWGDGTVDKGEASPAQCPAYPSPTANPGPYQPASDHRTFTRSHVYRAAGDYRVVVTVRSVNADCRPHGPKPETASVTFEGPNAIHVS